MLVEVEVKTHHLSDVSVMRCEEHRAPCDFVEHICGKSSRNAQ